MDEEKVTDLSAERDACLRQRDEAIGERNELFRQRDVAIGERNEISRQRDAWIGVFNEFERQIDLTIEDRNLPAERRLWRIREIVHNIAYETAVPDEKLTTSAKVLRYIRAGATVIVVLPFVLLIMPFLAACGLYDRARQTFTAKPDR